MYQTYLVENTAKETSSTSLQHRYSMIADVHSRQPFLKYFMHNFILFQCCILYILWNIQGGITLFIVRFQLRLSCSVCTLVLARTCFCGGFWYCICKPPAISPSNTKGAVQSSVPNP